MRDRHKKPIVEPFQNVADDVKKFVPDKVVHSHVDSGHRVDHTEKLVIRAAQIAIGMPADELMFSKFFSNYMGIGAMPWDPVITTESTYLPDARNQIHNIFLEQGVGSHLLMLDSDVLPPSQFMNTLFQMNLPIVGGWYVKKERYAYKDLDGEIKVIQRPVVYDYKEGYVQRISPGTGLEKVAGAGAGAWLMRRDVAEKLGKSPYDMNGGGEDLRLCDKIREAGFDIYVDWSLKCAHAGVFYV